MQDCPLKQAVGWPLCFRRIFFLSFVYNAQIPLRWDLYIDILYTNCMHIRIYILQTKDNEGFLVGGGYIKTMAMILKCTKEIYYLYNIYTG